MARNGPFISSERVTKEKVNFWQMLEMYPTHNYNSTTSDRRLKPEIVIRAGPFHGPVPTGKIAVHRGAHWDISRR